MSSTPLLPVGLASWDRAMQAFQRIHNNLLRATAAVETAGVPCAVVGGHAVAVWVARVDAAARRGTPNVDLLIERPHLDAATAALEAIGFRRNVVLPDVGFLDGDGRPRNAVQLWFAGEKVRPGYLLRAPDVAESEPGTAFRVVTLAALVRMKLTSFRRVDRVHLRDLMGVGLVDATWPARFPPELAARLQELLDDPNG